MRALQPWLFPHPPRSLPYGRAWSVGLRSLHILSMGVLLGGVFFGLPDAQLHPWGLMTLGSGLLLLSLDLWKSFDYVFQGSALALLLKLILVGTGYFLPEQRVTWYALGTLAASIGSHMTGNWRHYSVLQRRVLRAKDPQP